MTAPKGLAMPSTITAVELRDRLLARIKDGPTEDFLRLADQYARIAWEKMLYGQYTYFRSDGLHWYYGNVKPAEKETSC